MEIIPDGVIDESLSCFGFTTGLVLKHHIIIPPKQNKCMQNRKKMRLRQQTNRVNRKNSHFGLASSLKNI